MHKLITVTFFAVVILAAWASAQTCIIPAPTAPPRAKTAVINCPGDGGYTGCTGHGEFAPSAAAPTNVPIGNAKCAVACAMADQSVANDNGWADGGSP